MTRPIDERTALDAHDGEDEDAGEGPKKNLQLRVEPKFHARVAALARAKSVSEPRLLRLALEAYLADAERNITQLRKEIRERYRKAAEDELSALDELHELAPSEACKSASAQSPG